MPMDYGLSNLWTHLEQITGDWIELGACSNRAEVVL